MMALLAKLFKLNAKAIPARATEPIPALGSQNAPSKRKYAGSKRRHAPKGTIRGDINSGLIEQARRARSHQ